MHSNALKYLTKWAQSEFRKPLIIRGARQIGKTSVSRQLAELAFEELVEINLEKQPEIAELILNRPIEESLKLLRSFTGKSLIPGKSLLLIDEIQAAPEVISALRYFYEEMPSLHVLATGSLLEFALSDKTFSMPVGRVEYLFLGPVTFFEYLEHYNEADLLSYLREYSMQDKIPLALHNKAISHFRDYLFVGGMPESIATFKRTKDPLAVEKVKSSIIQTYQEDFAKYKSKMNHERLVKVYKRSVGNIGNKYKYVNIDRNDTAYNIQKALELLCLARVYHKILHSSASKPPFEIASNDSIFKVIFIDVGLMASLLGVTYDQIETSLGSGLNSEYIGSQAEQFIGQHLLYKKASYLEPQLYYWVREKAGSSAEIDYLQEVDGRVIPVEVKSGTSGRMKSMHSFIFERKLNLGLRYHLAPPEVISSTVKIPAKGEVSYNLLSLPPYLVERQDELIRECFNKG